MEYRIVECGVNTDVFKDVKVNDASIYADRQPHPGASDNHKDFGIDYKSTKDRATVKYENEVDPDALRTVTITKKLFKENGVDPISFEEDSTMFKFRLSIASEFDELAPADVYTYHVKDADRYYCYWDKVNKCFASTGIDDYDSLSEEQKSICSFTTSIYGTISNVPADHTLELRNVLVGTQFKIEERSKEVPDGYSFQKYLYNGREYLDEDAGLTDLVRTGEDPHVDICNIKGWGLRVNKIWSDADYMEDLNRMAEGYAAMKVSPRQVSMVLDAMFPVPADAPQKKAAEIAAKKTKFEAQFRKAMDSPDNYVFRDTAWQLVNAYTDVLTHAPLSGKSTYDSQFVKVTFGNDTSKFLKIIDEVAV